jgi:predicted S18 family serine protease
MFDSLKPPTDNLYKFIALTGLLILVISIVLPSYALYALELKRLEAAREINITKGEIEESKALKLLLDSAEKTVASAKLEAEGALEYAKLAKLKKGSPSTKLKTWEEAESRLEKAMTHLRDTSSDYGKKTDEYYKLASSIARRTIDNEYQTEVLEAVNVGVVLTKLLIICGVPLGLIFMLVGFLLWYRKVQKFEDKVLEKAAREILNGDKLSG